MSTPLEAGRGHRWSTSGIR